MIKRIDPLPSKYHVLHNGTKESAIGTQVEKYFDDFKNVRLVPVRKVLDLLQLRSEKEFGSVITKLTQHLSNGNTTTEDFYTVNDPQSIDRQYRTIIKMHWLINDIRAVGCKEPIYCTLDMSDDRGVKTYQGHIHPGTFRRHVYELMDMQHDCILFDYLDHFPDYPKLSLQDIFELYEENDMNFEVAVLPHERNLNTPQILNFHKEGKLANIVSSQKEWEKNVRHLWNNPINIFVGYDSTHSGSTQNCINSITRNLDSGTIKLGQYSPFECVEVNDYLKIHKLDVSKIPDWTREYKNQSTEFTYSRFLIPYLSNYEGMSIFCDDDFIFTDNILNILYFISADHAVACVKHDFSKKSDTKFNNQKDVWYDKKLWSSLMVFNNSHPDCKKLTLDKVLTESGQYLHQFEWTEEEKIAEIPKKWNWCEGYDDMSKIHQAKGMHWTRGGPWIPDMDCSDIQGLGMYSYYAEEMNNKKLWRTAHDISEYYDLKNPISTTGDGSLVCKEINR